MKHNILFFALVFVALLFSCKDPEPIHEEEVINKITWEFTAPDNSTVTASYTDPDGDGPNPAQVINANLVPNTTYTARLRLFNTLGTTEAEITPEVIEESTEHQVFYLHAVGGLTIAYDDQDSNGKPVGLNTRVTTTSPAAGPIRIVLRHRPDKAAAGVQNGDITKAGGESDIDISIPSDIR